jgi:tRNA splicing endonuclease
VDNEKRKRAAEDMDDAMRALKNRANHSKQDMDILAALEEMRSMKVQSGFNFGYTVLVYPHQMLTS